MSTFASGRYFEQHPGRVLGAVSETTNQYRQIVTVVKGTVAEAIKAMALPQLKPTAYVLQPLVIPGSEVSPRTAGIAAALKKSKAQKASPAPAEDNDLITFDEMLTATRGNMSDDEICAWVFYQMGRLFKRETVSKPGNGWSRFVRDKVDPAWAEKGIVAFDGKEHVPNSIYYAGNIYTKIRDMRMNEQTIVTTIGRDAYARQLARLEKCRPTMLRLGGPKAERLHLSPFDPFCENYKIGNLADGNAFSGEISLREAFKEWTKTQPASAFKNGSSQYDVVNLYVDNDSNTRGVDKIVWASRKRKASIDGAALFAVFLAEGVTREDQQKIEYLWNAEYNFWVEYDFHRIPLGFECNRYFKGSLLEIRDVQKDGVKFGLVNGASCNAYDVGLGKTITAILTGEQALYTGQAKRLLFVVPQPTLKKWAAEISGKRDKSGKLVSHGILPHRKLNVWGNLGVDVLRKGLDDIEDGSITLLSYEGLEKLGMGEDFALRLRDQLGVILNQGGEVTARSAEKLNEKLMKNIGNLVADTVVNVDDCGFDFFVVDEAHNAKNLFRGVKGRATGVDDKGKVERGRNDYAIGSAAPPSDRALKTFMVSQYVLQNNNMRNVMLLSATPFTNSPLEVYSMLALVAYQSLKERGLENLIDFFDKFVLVEYEDVVTVKGVENKRVVKAFANRIVLQSIIFSYFNYRSGDDLGEDGQPIVPRPKKVVYPLVKDADGVPYDADTRVSTALKPSDKQAYWLKEIAHFARKEPNAVDPTIPEGMYQSGNRNMDGWKRLLPGRDLMAINMARSITLSPYLLEIAEEGGPSIDLFRGGIEIDGKFVPETESLGDPSPKEFVENSPKLLYTVRCIESVRKHHLSRGEAVSGQVIYMNRGVHMFHLLKKYLVEQSGFAESEVEIISGSITPARKEKVKEAFLNGDVKIIIGSPTIEEGIDLQTRSTVLYMETLPWNPTTIKQVEGRIHRQGNQHTHVRIVNPLLENSIDVFMFQKLEEKTSRINSIWSRAGRSNILKLEELDPRELKRGLMTDPAMMASAVQSDEKDAANNAASILIEQVRELKEAQGIIVTYNDQYLKLRAKEQEAREYLKRAQAIDREDAQKATTKADRERAERSIERIEQLLTGEETFKNLAGTIKLAAKLQSDWRSTSDIDDFIRQGNKLDSIESAILKPEGLDRTDDFTHLIDAMSEQMAEAVKQAQHIASPEYLQQLVDKFTAETAEAAKGQKDIAGRVAEFERHNHLLSCISAEMECTLDGAGIPKMVVVKKPGANDAPRTDSPAAEPKRTLTKDQRIRLMKARALAYLLLNQAA